MVNDTQLHLRQKRWIHQKNENLNEKWITKDRDNFWPHLYEVYLLWSLRQFNCLNFCNDTRLMTLNRVKLGRVVTFMNYLASVVSLIFLSKTLIWNNTTFSASNSLILVELMVNQKYLWRVSPNIYQYSFFYSIYYCLI